MRLALLAPSVLVGLLYLFLVSLAFLALLVEFTNEEIRVQNLLFQILDVIPVANVEEGIGRP